MTKEDLKYGNVLETKEGIKYLYHCQNEDKFLTLDYGGFLWVRDFNENLKFNDADCNEFDIMKIYKDYTCTELLWERKEKPILTESERTILENIDKKYKWIARDKGDNLSVFVGEPIKLLAILSWGEEDCEEKDFPFDDLFQFIKWEDNRPYNIRDLLKEDESK